MNLAEYWNICTQVLWDETYIEGLEELFRKYKVTSILDVAGGTGFPSIQLSQKGWGVAYVDGSSEMVEFFQKRCKGLSLIIPTYHLSWQNLDRLPGKYDAVMCRGNSLIYSDSWGGDLNPARVLSHIKAALTAFHAKLKGGGILYVDITNRSEFEKPQPVTECIAGKKVEGKTVDITWTFSHDEERKVRKWLSNSTIGDKTCTFGSDSYLMTPDELRDLLIEVGFSVVQEIIVPGESVYTSFLARK